MNCRLITIVLFCSLAAAAGAATAPPKPEEHGPVWSSVHRQHKQPTTQAPPAPPVDSDTIPYEDLRRDVHASLFLGLPSTKHKAYSCNLYGLEVEYARHLTRHHSFTLSASMANGSKDKGKWAVVDGERIPFTNEYRRTSVCLMAGWRTSLHLSSSLLLSAGAKAGIDIHVLNVDFGRNWLADDERHKNEHHDHYHSDSDSDPWCNKHDSYGNNHAKVGFAYALSGTVSYCISYSSAIFVGYTYRASTAAPDAEPGNAADPPRVRTSAMGWHEIHIGYSKYF